VAKKKQTTVGWVTGVNPSENCPLFSADALMRRGRGHGLRNEIERKFGKPIPAKVAVGSAEQQELIKAVQKVYARHHPEDAKRLAANDAETTRTNLAPSAQQKLDAAIRAHKRLLEMEIEDRITDRLNEILPTYSTEYDQYQAFNNAYQGPLTREEFKRLLSCLHSDKLPGLDEDSRRRYDTMFRIIKEKQQLLCGLSESEKSSGSLPRTVEELLARRKCH